MLLRGWRALHACSRAIDQVPAGLAKAWKKKEQRRAMLAGGRGVRDRKALAKRKVVQPN